MFEKHHELWMVSQRKARRGESLRRLNEGHAFVEKRFLEEVWWPAIGNFEFLYAEYEVPNTRNSSYYLDFAYIRSPYRIDFEVDDFSSHAKNITRRGFDYELDRHNQLMHDDWRIYRYSLDAIKERPLQCRQSLLQIMGKLYSGIYQESPKLTLKQREIMRLANRSERSFTPEEACSQLGLGNRHIRNLLHELVSLGLLEVAAGSIRARSYRATPRGKTIFLG
ncbi:DNA-binding response regulator [Cohnella cholangitidis]|uniref:DNA-binding response regulator n=1 Tax=Cohnella cholangitidis TaxID=2598458 RepID=UPI001C715E6E|nr:DNA-binding response regulator [Cohnella cholangitidis]